jgi:ketosteroid isomerase-like protein
MAAHHVDLDSVMEANRAFYQAFEDADMDTMSDLWEHSDRVTCGHPGWAVLRGWAKVSASWMTLFAAGGAMQFILTGEQVSVVGDAAWVTLDENILSARSGSTVSAINVFVRSAQGWKIVAHHGSGVVDTGVNP